MATHAYYVPPVNLMGRGCLQDAAPLIEQMGIRKALVVTDQTLVTSGTAECVLSALRKAGLDYVVYDEVQPNPTCLNVHEGLQVFQDHGCDAIISIGGGSPQDAAKAIGIVAQTVGISVNMKDCINRRLNRYRLSLSIQLQGHQAK